MAKKKNITKGKAEKQYDGPAKNVEFYEHTAAKRLNNPPVGLVNTKTEKEEKKKTYNYDPHLDPTLQWAGKSEKTSFEIPTVSLHVHERIDPRTVIDSVKKTPEKIWEQLNLFNRPINKLSFLKEIEFYKHQKDWSNRLIAGDSLLVMNSLLEKEGMAGKVQTVYIDPPYGINYGSNFQPFVNQTVVKDKDQDLNQEPEMLRAFRDTWVLGIHSYLSYMRDRLLLSRDLLNDTGSVFVQISDDNAHYLRNLLDEVFGAQNFMCNLRYRTRTMTLSSNFIDVSYDHVLWYAKDRKQIKFNKLYLRQDVQGDPNYKFVELVSGERRPMTKEEHDNHSLLPKGARVFRYKRLRPTQYRKNQDFNFEFDGEVFPPPGGNVSKTPDGVSSWSTTLEGMNNLKKQKRLVKTGKELQYVLYFDDYPVTTLGAVWTDTAAEPDKRYVVQTSPRVIERCILMTSFPGDLVLDPTCGSGTTAWVCEKQGRRWITCDSSRISVAIAKQRLTTSIFDYYHLQNPEDGVDGGFIYEKVPHVTMGSLANGERPGSEELFDQPEIDGKKARVSGPFTVEAVPAPVVREIGAIEDQTGSLNGPNDWIQELLKSGIRIKNKNILKLSRLEPLSGTKWLHADGNTDEEAPQRIVVSFGPDFAPLEQRQVELALQEAEKIKPSPTIVVFAAFQFDPEAAKDIDQIDWGGVSILKVQMNADLFTDDLKKKKSSNESFWLVGQPDVSVSKIKSGEDKGKFQVTVNGFDYYNPKDGTVSSGGATQIAMWMLDTDYDGRSLLPKQIFFPMAGAKDGWAKLAKSLKNEIDEELIEAYRGTESLPFEVGENKKIAVKIIDDRGIESLLVEEIE